MTKASRTRGMPRRSNQPASQSNRTRWVLIAGAIGVVAVAAVVAIVLSLGSSTGPPEPAADRIVVTGEPLPALPLEGPDPAIGMSAPDAVSAIFGFDRAAADAGYADDM